MSKFQILILILLTMSCSLDPVGETDATKVTVLAVLSPDYVRQTIMLVEGTNIFDVDGLYPSELDHPVQGARMVVRSAKQTVEFTEVSPGLYQDAETQLQVVSGESYFLEVQEADGPELFARTTVPGAFRIIAPEDSATFVIESEVAFSWQRSSGAGTYVLGRNLFECEKEFFGRNFGFYGSFDKTQTKIIAWINIFCNSSLQAQTFKVLAYDSSLAAYLYSVDSNGAPLQRSNIDGGLGVFGSMVSDSLTIVVTSQ